LNSFSDMFRFDFFAIVQICDGPRKFDGFVVSLNVVFWGLEAGGI